MKLIVIFGPSAVGKMTVGKELEKITDYKLFHNNMIIEPIYNFFGYGTKQFSLLLYEFRNRLFEELGQSDITGIVFTYVWALNEQKDHDTLLNYLKSMNINVKNVLFVELEADQDIRIERNKSEFRLQEKKSKNNIQESENFIYKSEEIHRLNSNNDFFYPNQLLKINNSKLEASAVASLIKEELNKIKNESCFAI